MTPEIDPEVGSLLKELARHPAGRRARMQPLGRVLQDDIDMKRSKLIEEIERQLKSEAQCETVFTIRWETAESGGAS